MSNGSFYIDAIALLLPLSAAMVVTQANPYYSLITRGILGAVAALIYTLLGAADVALTEALVGTLLAIALYAVAVRSSLVMRLGVLQDEVPKNAATATPDHAGEGTGNKTDDEAIAHSFNHLLTELRTLFNKYHLRVELVPYDNPQLLHQALLQKDIHATCVHASIAAAPYQLTTRVRRLYEILQAGLSPDLIQLNHVTVSDAAASHYQPSDIGSVLVGEEKS